MFLAPSLLGILIFVVGPILMSVVISFTDWRLASRLNVASLRDNWVGFENYVRLLSWDEAVWSPLRDLAWRLPLLVVTLGGLLLALRRRAVSLIWGVGLMILAVVLFGWFAGLEVDWSDRRFWQATWNTLYFVGFSVPLTVAISLLLASALNRSLRGIAFYRAAYFMPVISGAVVVALVWRWMFNPTIGPINQFLGLLGVTGPGWLTSREWAMPALIITDVWSNIGFYMVIFLAGLQGIPQHYYEAAELDGAGKWQKFWSVTVPLLSATTFLNLILALIAAFQVFTLPYIMTDGGPAGATRVLVFYMYERAFDTPFRMGYGSAIAWILFLIIFAITALQWYARRKWVIHEE
ncbi:MAG TPA: sugar ABC transporter permease [Trueperaceae bacterium]|nr:sugar ABC transporter permease [Trueperaceae bacterium]